MLTRTLPPVVVFAPNLERDTKTFIAAMLGFARVLDNVPRGLDNMEPGDIAFSSDPVVVKSYTGTHVTALGGSLFPLAGLTASLIRPDAVPAEGTPFYFDFAEGADNGQAH